MMGGLRCELAEQSGRSIELAEQTGAEVHVS